MLYKNQFAIDHFEEMVNLRCDAYRNDRISSYYVRKSNEEMMKVCLKPYLTEDEINLISNACADSMINEVFEIAKGVFDRMIWEYGSKWNDKAEVLPCGRRGYKLGSYVYVTELLGSTFGWNGHPYFKGKSLTLSSWKIKA